MRGLMLLLVVVIGCSDGKEALGYPYRGQREGGNATPNELHAINEKLDRLLNVLEKRLEKE